MAEGPQGRWSGDGKRGGKLRLERADGTSLEVRAPPETYLRLVASPDGRFLGAFSWPLVFRVMDTTTQKWSEPLRLSGGSVGPVIFSPDGEWIASGADDHLVSIRDSTSGRSIASLAAHQGTILALAFSPDGRTMVSSAQDGTIRLWHTKTWRDLGVLARGEPVTRLEFDATGKTLRAFNAKGARIEFRGGE